MKKTLVIFLVAILMLCISLTSCDMLKHADIFGEHSNSTENNENKNHENDNTTNNTDIEDNQKPEDSDTADDKDSDVSNEPDSDKKEDPDNGNDALRDIEYTITVITEGGMPLSGITVYVHSGDGYNLVAVTGHTDSKGVVRVTLPQSNDYSFYVEGAPNGYKVKSGETKEERYPLSQPETTLTLSSAPTDTPKNIYHLGDVMHNFTLTDVYGNAYTLSELLKEKDMVMLNFWFKSCIYCAYEFPHINTAYGKYKNDVEILALNDYDSVNTIKGYPTYLGTSLDFPLVSTRAIPRSMFPGSGYPTTVIIDRYGVVCAIIIGAITYESFWSNLFDHFTADDYQQRLIINVNEFLD